MDKSKLKKHIAETAFNVGYTAKLHFASLDIIEKTPNILNFISIIIGIFGLTYPSFSTKFIASTLLIFGIASLCLSMNKKEKEEFEKNGIELTNIFNQLKHLMSEVDTQENLDTISEQLKKLETTYNNSCASNHIFGSSWFAHYKFFWEQQIGWIEEHRPFHFFRDKIPLTFWFFIFFAICFFIAIKICRINGWHPYIF